MAIAQRLLGTGVPAAQAQNIVGDFDPAITATGTTQATAYQLFAAVSQVTTAAASTGVILPTMSPGDSVFIYNAGANTLSIYPPVGENINAVATNGAYTVATVKGVYIVKVSATKYVTTLTA